jgi:hypothetical protein
MPMRPTTETAILTVATIRRLKGTSVTEYLFNEREQIFRAPSAAKSRAAASTRLRAALRQRLPVKAVLDPRRGIVRRIDAASPEEIAAFERHRVLLEKPDRSVRIKVSSIDPTTFNIVDQYLKFRTFRLCARVVPNYKTARKIFDFCAQQSCHLPGPPTVTPCIPFQYVRDGCYARAHKMRKIIVERYRYCCDKVFSFANQNGDTLAVRADKWGGCCVTWWYHVAPLIRVRIRIGHVKFVLALVIDPSMFDKPVLLSTWLTAQENASCAANANVSMYSIQPGSAYSPANYQGTSFATDPAYTDTNATLIGYQNLTTCP